MPIRLRAPTFGDANFLRSLEQRPEVYDRIGRIPASVESPGITRIVEKDGVPVGIASIVRQKVTNQDLELVCAIAHGSEGMGLATAACRMILREFQRPPAARIFATIAKDNDAGVRLAEKLGFIRQKDSPVGRRIFLVPDCETVAPTRKAPVG